MFISEYDEVRKVYLLNFRGVLFSFTETEGGSNSCRVSWNCVYEGIDDKSYIIGTKIGAYSMFDNTNGKHLN